MVACCEISFPSEGIRLVGEAQVWRNVAVLIDLYFVSRGVDRFRSLCVDMVIKSGDDVHFLGGAIPWASMIVLCRIDQSATV